MRALLLLGLASGLAASAAALGEGLVYLETFDTDVLGNGPWKMSLDGKYADQEVEVAVAEEPGEGYEEDKGLFLAKDGFGVYGVGVELPEPVDNTDKDLVIQYEVKHQGGLTCGGSYIKLLRTENSDVESLKADTPYSIMFGPDKCGANNKVHFILQHQSPTTEEWEEKHFDEPPTVSGDKFTHLYTLHIRADNSFSMYVDAEEEKTGNLLESMTPPVNPPKLIDDPEDSKPEDWVDEAKIPDPEAVKPEDWDEDQPERIPDPDKLEAPEGWLTDAPLYVPDPEAVVPEDWDTEEDGEFEAPLVANPACEAVGCGEYTPPMIKNPLFKGKWSAPMIDNPAYVGPWKPRQIENPAWFEDLHPHNVAPFKAIAIEVLHTNGKVLLDNFVIAHDIGAALAYAEETFKPKQAAEKAKKKQADSDRRAEERKEKMESGSFVEKLEAHVQQGVEYLVENPTVGLSTLGALIVSMIFCAIPRGRKRQPGPTAEEAEGAEETKGEADDEGEDEDEDEGDAADDADAPVADDGKGD